VWQVGRTRHAQCNRHQTRSGRYIEFGECGIVQVPGGGQLDAGLETRQRCDEFIIEQIAVAGTRDITRHCEPGAYVTQTAIAPTRRHRRAGLNHGPAARVHEALIP